MIYRAVKTNHLNQPFGADNACIHRSNGDVISKPKGGCPKHYINLYTDFIGMKGHNAEDWATWHGEPLYFPADLGVAWRSKDSSEGDGGVGVDVYSYAPVKVPSLPSQAGSKAKELWNKQNGYLYVKFRFWHLKQAWTDKDVQPGELIGYCDNTGLSSGDHLHGPQLKFVTKDGDTIDTDNGYYGSVNYRECFPHDTDTFVLSALEKKGVELSSAQQLSRLFFIIRNLPQYAQYLTRLMRVARQLVNKSV